MDMKANTAKFLPDHWCFSFIIIDNQKMIQLFIENPAGCATTIFENENLITVIFLRQETHKTELQHCASLSQYFTVVATLTTDYKHPN